MATLMINGIGVAIGHYAGTCFPRETIRYVAAGLFIVMGILMALKVV